MNGPPPPPPRPGPKPRPAPLQPRTVLSPLGRFAVAVDIPARGWSGAHVWPDTGVLLSMGRKARLRARFVSHYAGRASVVQTVSGELDHLADVTPARLPPQRVAARDAALSIRPVLVSGAVPVVPAARPGDEDEERTAEHVIGDLRALPQDEDDLSFRHGGEAAVILACLQGMKAGGRHIMLANDGPASKIAAKHGVLTRHAAHVLAEFACADAALDPQQLHDDFTYTLAVSRPPADCLPAGAQDFTCWRADDGTCARCD